MSVLLSENCGLPLYTSTTMGATGATTLVSAPAAGQSLLIHSLHVIPQTNTTGYMEVTFREGAAGSTHFRTLSNSLGALAISRNLDVPITVDTATSWQAIMSVTAASTPSVWIGIGYQVITRRADNELRVRA